jgi:phosphinothricin acetyltransferase
MPAIHLATRDDIPAILDISNWAALNTPANFAIEPEALDSWLASFDQIHMMFPWLVATDADSSNSAGAITGFAKASPHRNRCAYAWSAETTVYVHPEHVGRGVGTALYGKLIAILRAQGYATLTAGITTPNPASERLHTAFGFKRIGAFERIGWKFNRWHDVSYWQLMLSAGGPPPLRIKPVAEVWRQVQPLPAGA